MSDRVQSQFLNVIDRDEAERRFHGSLELSKVDHEDVDIENVLGRILAENIVATNNVPSFDRSNYDGFAVRAADTYAANEESPQELALCRESIASGHRPEGEVVSGSAMAIATGGMLPRGADAVVMIEHTDTVGDRLCVRRAVTPGFGISWAGTDIEYGETVLFSGTTLGSRETGVLAAIGTASVPVYRRVRVAIISTGDEIISPGSEMQPGLVYDSNAQILADSVRELGADPLRLGIVRDDYKRLKKIVAEAQKLADVVLLSGGTSKGAGDLCYRVVEKLKNPGIVAHGIALKPGKPVCLAVEAGKAVVVLPGFPTSAIFTFHEFVAPVIRKLGGGDAAADHRASRSVVNAKMAIKVISEIGRTEYMLVGLVPGTETETNTHLVAYPMGKGSGSVTAFGRADGFITIGRHEEFLEADTPVRVQLLGTELQLADLVVIGSHCVGLDYLLSRLQEQGFRTKCMAVGSTGGLDAVRKGECDLAGIHLLCEKTDQYNRPLLEPDMELISGYHRQQGLVYRRGDARFQGCSADDAIASATRDKDCRMVGRNQGSGTRILLDKVLAGARPPGYEVQPKSHNAVAVAVAQRRADWGIAIESVAAQQDLGFIPIRHERFDFVAPSSRMNRPAVLALKALLEDREVRDWLEARGLSIDG
ncbi:MAG TPA: molybdopterin biosynthesis protein [Pirellulales bacterium]|nr:molybdopterin biosynthesis protein [Pirellulales bacterium]